MNFNWRKLTDLSAVRTAWYIESEAARWILRRSKPDMILHFLGGLGDELLLTCIAHELHKRTPSLRIWQISHAAQLLQDNPDYTLVLDKSHWALRHSNILKHWRQYLCYSSQALPGVYEIPPKEHILAILCRKTGIRGTIQLRPWYYQQRGEANRGRIAEQQIVVHSAGGDTHETWMQNKAWYHSRFQEVVNRLRDCLPGYMIVQLGVDEDMPLNDVLDLRGKTSLRETAAIISQADCFIGISGLFSHLARAVDCRSVIIYGGREHSWQSGYICNENLESKVQCAPCWLWKDCDFNRKCMDMISSDDVVDAVLRVLSKRDAPLEVEEVVITDSGTTSKPPWYPKVPGWGNIANLPPFVHSE